MQSLLALLHAGAKGNTATQINNGLSLTTEQIQRVYPKILTSDQTTGKSYIFQIQHKIYLQKNYTVSETFNKTANDNYNAAIAFLDFNGDVVGATAKINDDIEEATTIENFLSVNDLRDYNTFLYSSFFYESHLFTECPIRRRLSATFFPRKIPIGFGEFIGYFNYYESVKLNAKFLEIPYVGNETVLTIILPNNINGLSDLETNFLEVLQTKIYTKTKLIVRLPDFNSAANIDVTKLFENVRYCSKSRFLFIIT